MINSKPGKARIPFVLLRCLVGSTSRLVDILKVISSRKYSNFSFAFQTYPNFERSQSKGFMYYILMS